MKTQIKSHTGFSKVFIASLGLAVGLSACSLSFADSATDSTTSSMVGTENVSSVKIDEPVGHPSSAYDQLVTLQFGAVSPKSLQITNGSYTFNYGNPSSLMGQAGWAIKLFDLGGSFYFEENVGFTSFSGNSIQSASTSSGGSSYTLDLFGFDTRLMYAADWFPWKVLVPFIDGGYQYSLYFQPGTSGLDSVDGGVGNAVAGAGARLWLNRKSSIVDGNNPIFLSAKVNRVFAASNSLNLESTSFFGGLSLGL